MTRLKNCPTALTTRCTFTPFLLPSYAPTDRSRALRVPSTHNTTDRPTDGPTGLVALASRTEEIVLPAGLRTAIGRPIRRSGRPTRRADEGATTPCPALREEEGDERTAAARARFPSSERESILLLLLLSRSKGVDDCTRRSGADH